MLLFLYQVLSVKSAVQQTVAVSNLLERRQCAASSSPFERMAIFESFADGGLNDSEKIILRGVSEDAPLFMSIKAKQ